MISQKILNPVKQQLLKRRYRNKKNPFEEFNKLKEGDILPTADKGVIFVGPIKMSAIAHLFEGIIAYYYRKKGYKVYAVMCGQKLNHCESKGLSTFDNLKCSVCYAEQIEFCKTFSVEPLWMNDYISDHDSEQIKAALSMITLTEMTYEGVDLSSQITSGLMRVLKTSVITDDKKDLLAKYAQTALSTFVASRNMLRKHQPSHVIMSHGTYSTWGSLNEACKSEGVHSLVWGRGYVGKGNIFATHGESYLFGNIVEPMKNFEDVELTADQLEKTESYFAGKRDTKSKVDYISYYEGKENIAVNIDVRRLLNLDASKPIIGMFPNIPWDGQAFSYSEVFPSIREFIKFSIEWMKGKDAYLVIRAHPGESHKRSQGQLETFENILFELYPELPENVLFLSADHDITSYQLEEHITTALLYAGTLGLEFSVNGTPVIQAGKNSNSGKGFIYEPSSLDEFGTLLQKAVSGDLKITDEMRKNCMKYGYHWVYRRHFPETIVKFKSNLEFDGFYIHSVDELMEQKPLIRFVECIENQEDFIYYG